MPKKSKETKIEPSVFRVMEERVPFKFTTTDFQSKDEALNYVHELTSSTTAWYGVYELNPKVDYLISVENKRLIPHDDRIIVKPKEDDTKVKRRSPRKVKQK